MLQYSVKSSVSDTTQNPAGEEDERRLWTEKRAFYSFANQEETIHSCMPFHLLQPWRYYIESGGREKVPDPFISGVNACKVSKLTSAAIFTNKLGAN